MENGITNNEVNGVISAYGLRRPLLVFITTDGSALENGRGGAGGWGAIIRCGARSVELSDSELETTNNRMELLGAIKALEYLKVACVAVITTDSEYVKKGITEWIKNWKVNGWRTKNGQPVKNQDLWQALDLQCHRHQVEWKWVKGHTGHPDNERCDALAIAAAKQHKIEKEK